MPAEYKGCAVSHEYDPKGKYFGFSEADGCDSEGYAKNFVKVKFPDGTWVDCINEGEAKKYIDGYLTR
jgi:hypothetical protein